MYDHYVQKFRLKRAKTDRKAKRSPKWLRMPHNGPEINLIP